jgi:predicted nucleotidyltransferase
MYTIEELKERVSETVRTYNQNAKDDAKIKKVSLFGSYAKGCAQETSDVDLLVAFSSSVVSLFTLARALDSFENHLAVPVDIIQDPIPSNALFDIEMVIPLYE